MKDHHHYNTILSFYNIKTLQEEFAKKSNIPWIWRIIYGHKLPYMKKTRKKKQVCGAACFMAAEIKFSKDICPSVRPSVCPSICGQNRVRSVSSTIVVGSILYLYILLNFWQIFGICYFDFVFLWHGIWSESLVWVIMGQRGVSQNAGILVVLVGSDNGLSPGWRTTIIWTNNGILLIGPLGTNFHEILIEIYTFSLKKMDLKMSSAKQCPFCQGLNVLNCSSF